jgi:glutathione synthase/RimK-type ligase-like ATP-grasp enzyme
MRIAINKNDKIFYHSSLWTDTWIEYCKKNSLYFEIIDCYQPDVVERLKTFDCLLWHIENYVLQDMIAGRSILFSAKNMGLKTFPDFNTAWHFDDKVAETYLLQSVYASIPGSWMYYTLDDAIKWLEEKALYPLIAKLRCGSGSNNVKLLRTKNEAIKYSRQMFKSGFNTYPSMIFKAKSQLLSAKNWDVIKTRVKRLPEFIRTLSRAKEFPRERGYVFFQEYIPNDGHDLKVVVVGDKLSFIGRRIRKGDFRASGGGDLFFDRSLVTRQIITLLFSVSDTLGFQCMGYDLVVDKSTGEGKIVEISFGFSHIALLQAGGYFDRNCVWHDEPLNAPHEVLSNMISSIS